MRVFLWLPGSRAGQGRTGEGRARLGKAVKARPLTTGSPFDGVSSCSPLAHCFYPRPPPAPWAPVLGSPQAALPGEGRGGGGTRPGQGPGPLVTERTPSQDLLAEEPLGIGVGGPGTQPQPGSSSSVWMSAPPGGRAPALASAGSCHVHTVWVKQALPKAAQPQQGSC